MKHRQQGRRFRAGLQVERLEDRNLLSAGGLGDAPLAEIAVLPNDPSFGTQYALNNPGRSGGKVDADLDAPEAWKITTGSTKNVVAIVDMPDAASAAAASLTIGASGGLTGTLTVLLTPEEIDQATKKSARYTPPGK